MAKTNEKVEKVRETATKKGPASEVKAEETRKAATAAAVSGLTPEKLTGAIATASVIVAQTFARAQEIALERLTVLGELDKAIADKKEELKALFGVEVVEKSLEEHLAAYDALVEQHEQSIDEAREAWAKDQADHDARVRQREADLAEQRRREQDLYDYELKKKRQAQRDAFAVEDAQREATFRARNEALLVAEKELADLRAMRDGLDATIKAAVDKTVAIATNSVKKDYEQQAALDRARSIGEQRLAEQQAAAKDAEINRLTLQVATLQEQLNAANARALELAQNAVNGAAKQQALSELSLLQQRQPEQPRK